MASVDDERRIELELSERERSLMLDHTFVDTDMKRRLQLAEVRDQHLVVRMSLPDLDHLLGHVAATANHAKSRRLERRMEDIYDRLKAIEDEHKDR